MLFCMYGGRAPFPYSRTSLLQVTDEMASADRAIALINT